jgi:hypothetical protein
VVAVALLLDGTANMPAQSQRDKMSVEAIFSDPLLGNAALTPGSSSPIHASLKIRNESGRTLHIATYQSVLPELLSAAGRVAPFDSGVNRSRAPLATDYPQLLPGQSLEISVDATLSFQSAEELDWKDSDGTLGFWKIAQSAAPYRFRLRYLNQSAADPAGGGPVWTGEAATRDVALPLRFGAPPH